MYTGHQVIADVVLSRLDGGDEQRPPDAVFHRRRAHLVVTGLVDNDDQPL
jgi:hypothetical protein